MNFTEFFIRRGAFTIVVILIMTIVGLIGYANLPVRWIPNITPPVVSIYTDYAGASASLVESQITTPIEAALSGIEGVESLTSNSSQGMSNITLNFKVGRNMNAAVEDVRSSLANVVGSLPKDVVAPVVSKAQTDGMPILFLAFLDSTRSAKEVSDYVDQFIIPRLQTVDGVATVMTYGRRVSAMRIWLDPNRMASSNVTVDDVNSALMQQNIQVPSGSIRGADRFYNVVTNETLTSASQFNDLIIREDQAQTVRLKNVGEAMIAPANIDTAFRVEGQPAIAVGIIPQSTANPLDVSKHVLAAFAGITKSLPKGMKASVVYNQATFIQSSVHSVYEAVIEAIIFVLLVIYLFLANWRATFIPIITIPVCLITTFALLHFFKFSINTITLMAFVLAIGLVVDDAIVMLENIMRHIEAGTKPFLAAMKGSREMVFPIIAMTLTLAAVYTPIAFTSGILGSIFSEFALTLAGAVIVSGVVALTLTPMMCSRLLVAKQNPGRYGIWFAAHFQQLQLFYRQLLLRLLAKRIQVLVVLCVVGLMGYGIYSSLPSELAPTEDQDEINIFVTAPQDASFQYTDAYVRKLEVIYHHIPEATSYLAAIGGNTPSSSFQLINLKPWYKRFRSAQTIVNDLNLKAAQFAGVMTLATVPPSPLTWFGGGGGQGNNVEMAVMTVGEYKDLHALMQELILAAKKYPVFSRVDNQLKWDRSQFEVTIDREKAADLKVPMANITNTISTLLAGRTTGKFEYNGKQYDILLQMNQSLLANPNIIPGLYVRSDNHNMISLADLTTIHEVTSPGSLPHFERLRSDTLFASLAPGYTIADAIAVLEKVSKQVLPDNVKTVFVGEARNYLEANQKVLMTFFLALCFIYLVLVAQFESFIDPLVILFTVPFAVIGALLMLKLAGGTLNIYSEIGLVTLIGLIAKHGILMTEFANQQQGTGMSVRDAIIEAATLRLRPILMTTAAMILGALPLALAFGAGSETRHQVGWVIVGGLLLGTFFSLIVVPVAYTYLSPLKKISPHQADDIIFETGS
ncbi:MAG: efflux RND transporter permease subunit [Gammaproteobacteria bacterium]|nr:efflux RND transporter permease subunit [Gammaproteobacteria bacterium]